MIVVDPYESLKETEVSSDRAVSLSVWGNTCLNVLKAKRFGRESQGLDFQLESGLGELVSLLRLRVTDFWGTVHHMSAADLSQHKESDECASSVSSLNRTNEQFWTIDSREKKSARTLHQEYQLSSC